MGWWLWMTLAWGRCTLVDITAALDAVDHALEHDVRQVAPATEALDREVRCTKEMISATLAARLHHTWAVLAHRTKAPEKAALHLLAAWIAAPMIPRHPQMPRVSEAGDRLAVLQEKTLEERATSALPRTSYVDGHPAGWVLDGVPAILQQPGKKPKVVR